jgi:hypothetical protein
MLADEVQRLIGTREKNLVVASTKDVPRAELAVVPAWVLAAA